MVTSSKLRRLRRQRKLRRQRSAALMIVMVLILTCAHVAFSKQATENNCDVISVVVCQGDTLWSIAKQYKPEGEKLQKYVYEISSDNGIKDCNIVPGQTLFIPVANS